jgi:competence protein ComEA
MGLRSSAEHMREEAERRLARAAREWVPDAEGRSAEGEAPRAEPVRVALWTRPAMRGLAVLTAIIAAIVAYLMWQARPLEVAAMPKVIATGVPIDVPVSVTDTSDTSDSVESGPAPASSIPAPAVDVVVHVAGQVMSPGIVRLPAGSRVADAIEQAGGVTRRKALDSVNLARVLVDGEQVLVGAGTPALGGGPAAGVPSQGVPLKVSLNSATLEQLDSLPGVGPVLAGRILAWRTTHGRFTSIDELGEVSGIGESILEQLRPLVAL